MRTTSVVAALAAVASYAYAAPAAEPNLISDIAGKLAFTLEQTAGKMVLKNGAVARQKAYQKYNVKVPADVQSAAVRGSVSATPEQYDQEYLSPVTVGSDTLMLDFDTGSADLWVFSNKLPANQQSGHAVYRCTGTLKSGYTWKITYGDGSGAKGIVYSDKVVIGGVTATSQAVEAATSISAQFAGDTDNDGLVGLAFSSINTVSPTKQKTFFDNVKANLDSPLFVATLKYHAAGTYDFGYIDSSKYSGSIAYAPVNTGNGFWEFTASGYSVGSGAEVTGGIDSIADTGTSLILTSDSIVNNYYSKVSGAYYDNTQGGYLFPCSTTPPSFSLFIGSNKRTVPGKYINYAALGNGYCYGGIQSSGGLPFSIFGDVFLKSQVAVFDSNGPRVGFAQQAGVTG